MTDPTTLERIRRAARAEAERDLATSGPPRRHFTPAQQQEIIARTAREQQARLDRPLVLLRWKWAIIGTVLGLSLRYWFTGRLW